MVKALAAGHREAACRAFHDKPDWEKVADLAASHQVDALCWWMWKNGVARNGEPEPFELPPALGDRLKMAYLHHLLRNEALVNDLAVLHEALHARGVEAICFKGPWMSFVAYPDPGTRPVGDIDLGVREDDYEAAVAALQTAGWRSQFPLPRTSSEALLSSHYRRQLRFSARGRRPVELHFRLVNIGPPGVEERWVWDEARKLQAGPCRLRVPGPEAMLLHLLLHANQHGFAVLRTLHDIRWALGRDQLRLDVPAFLHLVESLHCQAACYHALQLAVELAGASVAGSMLEVLRPSVVRRGLFALTWNLRAVRKLEVSRSRMEAEAPLFYLFELGRLRDKASYLARVIAEAGGPRRLLVQARRALSKPSFARGRTR